MTTTGTRPGAQPPGGSRNLFVRNATGLVRELSAFDAFNLVFSAVLIPVGITEVMAFTPMFWPHANMLLSFLLATPLVATCGLVYLYFTVIMPRSGGDYVWVSRTLTPFLGFFVNFSITFVFLTWIAFNFTYMLSVMGPAAAFVGGWHSAALTSPSNGELMVVATILTAAFTILMIFGVRVVAARADTERLISTKLPAHYDVAVTLLRDLQELARHEDQAQAFARSAALADGYSVSLTVPEN